MQRLSGLDASFLYMETPSSPMHVASLIIFEDVHGEGTDPVEPVKRVYGERLHLAPPFRRRLLEVPFALTHPVWIEDPDFDLDWHIRHLALPSPGTREQLEDLAARLMAVPLDRTRPLWEVWVIDGLDDGSVAAVTKVHHSAIDGQAGEEILVSLLDLERDAAPVEPPEVPWEPEAVPTDTRLLADAAISLAPTPWRAARAVGRSVGVARDVRRLNHRHGYVPPPMPFTAPRTSLNQVLTPHRSFATESVSLEAIKEVKRAFGCTVNDVVLALSGTAVHKQLAEEGEHPDGPLIAMVPVSVRTAESAEGTGNEVTSMFTSLATDVDDPDERLRLIHAGTAGAKEQQELIGAEVLGDWIEFAAPALAGRAARLYSRVKGADRHRPIFNITISNVPGPPFPLYFAGAKLLATHPMGPIFDGGGLNITVMSYLDQMDFGLLACPDVVTDVGAIARRIGETLEEYQKAAAALPVD